MFGRLSYKGLKSVASDTAKSHLMLKGTNFPLIILRPYDMVQLGALVGSGSEDIIIWIGKTIGKNLCNAMQNEKIKKREKLIELILETLTDLGFGRFSMSYKENVSVLINVNNPISSAIKDKKDAKVLCNLYNGIFIGMFSASGVEIEGEEQKCVLNGDKECSFNYRFEV
jgi:predicted hydrocarbon binding protein